MLEARPRHPQTGGLPHLRGPHVQGDSPVKPFNPHPEEVDAPIGQQAAAQLRDLRDRLETHADLDLAARAAGARSPLRPDWRR